MLGDRIDQVPVPPRTTMSCAARRRWHDQAGSARWPAALGLQVADKPAAPCLASRIPHHHVVTPTSSARSTAPSRRCGSSDSRAESSAPRRRRADRAASGGLIRAVSDPLRTKVLDAVRGAGFRFVAVDVGGIQSGAFTLPLVSDHD